MAGVGCPYGEVPYERLATEADRVTRSGDELTFFDTKGEELLALAVRDTDQRHLRW